MPLLLISITFGLIPLGYWADFELVLPGLGRIGLDTLVVLALSAAIVVYLFFTQPQGHVSKNSISWMWVFLGLAFVSAIAFGMTGSFSGFRMLVRLTYPLLIFLLVLHINPSMKQIHQSFNLLLGLGVIIATWTFLDPSASKESVGVRRLTGLGSTSSHAYLMGIFCIIAYIRFWLTDRKISSSLLCGLFGLQVLMTVTRGAIVALAGALIVFEVFGNTKQSGIQRIGLASVLIGGLIIAVLFYAPLNQRVFGTQYKGVAQKTQTEQLRKSFEYSGRQDLWGYILNESTNGLAMVYGHGLGSAEIDLIKKVGGIPHNEYLRVLYELGWVGVILFLVALTQMWILAIQGIRSASSSEHLIIAGIFTSFLTLYALGGMVDNMFEKYKSMGALLFMALGFSLCSKTQPSDSSSSPTELPPSTFEPYPRQEYPLVLPALDSDASPSFTPYSSKDIYTR